MNTFLIFYIVVLIVSSLLWVLWLFLFSFKEKVIKENVWYIENMEDFTVGDDDNDEVVVGDIDNDDVFRSAYWAEIVDCDDVF